ncbi:lysylphosphatidylglycerol synthase transmembrane domain-containing protein [Nakamurella alba]|uniref:lysylphosphatidylglycerol synthase transmembrane domain-containing protein n=1 Tax=Nakamurella alba TaxID=2665158 RepID=UPI0018AA78D2|nr:lysylphosphatidylglycerol synthase transmembrane domain-containing protein [Nakamurella alba]
MTIAPELPVSRSRLRTWLPVVVGVALAGAALLLVRDRLPDPAELWSALTSAQWGWIGVAVLLQGASIGLVARQQRLLLGAFGVRAGVLRVQAITYGAGAVSSVLPAGGAVAGGYAFREYRRLGADPGTAGTVMVLSGVLSAIGLGLCALLLPALSGSALWWLLPAAVVVSLWLLTLRPLGNVAAVDDPMPGIDRWAQRRPRTAAVTRELVRAGRRIGGLTGPQLRSVLTASTAKWLLDAASLWLVCVGFGVSVALLPLLALYLGVQLIRQIPLTPGGTGPVEAALLAGLAAAGAMAAPAAAAVLIYRLLSVWGVVLVGGVAAVALTRGADVRRIGPGRVPW